MSSIKVVLLTEYDTEKTESIKSFNHQLSTVIERIVNELKYSFDSVDLNRLDFQENESLNKFTNADIVIMDATNRDNHPTFMYHKAFRQGIDCLDDIILIQASDIENDDTIQDFKTTCVTKYLIEYQYNKENRTFYDVTNGTENLLEDNLNTILKQATKTTRQGLSDRYLKRLETRKNLDRDIQSERDYLWDKICNEIFTEENQDYATPKLITQLMYAFRDLQDYQSMIRLSERCGEFEKISNRIHNNTRILYLTAFARSRRNQDDDREKALQILERLRITKKTEAELSTDITCLCGRIYKDKYRESNCQDQHSFEKAIEWYRKGFDASHTLFAGINLLFFLAITTEDLKQNNETHKIILQINALLGKKARSLKDFTDYWDVAVYFELHAIQHDWLKACQGALHMYLLNPPAWHLKSTLNNFTILYQAICIRDPERSRKKPDIPSSDEKLYHFWIDFFKDAIRSYSPIAEERELPAQVPILLCDNYEKTDGTIVKNIFIEGNLQLNFHTENERETLAIHVLDEEKQKRMGDLVKKIEMSSIRSITNVKRDDRSIYLYAYENSDIFSSVELQIYFSSAERRTAFNAKMSKYRVETAIPEPPPEVDLEFEYDEDGVRTCLGQGSFGKVYVAYDRITMKKFAVKEISIRFPSYKEDLENEIKILSILNHKNIVSYYGTATDSKKKPPIFQIIMEYVDRGNISKLLAKQGKFSEELIANCTRQILEGVQYLHENHILHRDIKSANILVNSKGEIKIADFGTSRRLTGLKLCTGEIVGTFSHMDPNVVAVPPTGYGPAVDIWSVGCTFIEMATGKRPFHDVVDQYALAHKLVFKKEIPEIPSELSDLAKDFLAKCFQTTENRPTAKDLLNHPFLKMKPGLSREGSTNQTGEKFENGIRFSKSPYIPQRSTSEEDDALFHPAPTFGSQVSIDQSRRLKLLTILREPESRAAITNQWMDFIEETRATEVLDTDKLQILIGGMCDYIDNDNDEFLEKSLNKICDPNLRNTDRNIRIDLEKSFYLFTEATKNILRSKFNLPSHDFFALDNINRHIVEHFIGLIRTDFRPASKSVVSSTPNINSPSRISPSSSSFVFNDETTSLHDQYQNLVRRNQELLRRLVAIETNNEIQLQNGINSSSKHACEVFLPLQNDLNTNPSGQTNGQNHHHSPRGMKRSLELVELEQEHECILKKLTTNRTRINQILQS